jgi:hypothetical protein
MTEKQYYYYSVYRENDLDLEPACLLDSEKEEVKALRFF